MPRGLGIWNVSFLVGGTHQEYIDVSCLFSLSSLKVQGINCGWSSIGCMSRTVECEVSGNFWKMWSPHLTTFWFNGSLDYNNSFKFAWVQLASTERDIENILKAAENYGHSSQCLWGRPFPDQLIGHCVLFFAVVEPWVSVGLLQLFWIFPYLQCSHAGRAMMRMESISRVWEAPNKWLRVISPE